MNEESLFVAALEKPTAAERQAFLEEACAGDVALRQRVERLLAAHLKTLGILDQPARPPGWTDVTAGFAPGGVPAGERVGTVIAGRYRLLEEIGAGGMGTVWKAEQTQPVRRMVALKLIKAGMDSRTVLSRFEAERQALALMEHPNIARVLDGGTTESGRPFFVMEYVKGVPFTQLLRRRPPDHRPAPRALRAGLPGRPARPHQGRDPPRPEAQQHPGLPVRRPAGAESDRLRSGQGDPAAAHRAHAAHGPRRAAGHAAVHEPGTGRVQQPRRGRADGHLRPWRDPLRAADRDDAAGATAFPGGGLA